MPCIPIDPSSITPPASSIPGFGFNLPHLNIPLPDFPIDDLLNIFNNLNFVLPIVGITKPSLDADLFNNIFQGISDLLKKFLPYISMYRLILPILNLILCIIEVLCAIPNPFKLIRALRRLFRNCLPDLLSLFPYLAIIIMIISLLLLILALIEYIILRLLQLIERLIRNILILAKAAHRLDNDSIVSIVKKIGDLLCNLQNLFVIFGIIITIIQIIKSILSLTFKIPPCDSSDGSDDGCCTPDVCPSFIKNNSDILSSTGNFLYFNAAGFDSGLTLPPGFVPIVSNVRNESWQFYDPNLLQNQAFINITRPFDLPFGVQATFFPSGVSYDKTTNYLSTPYIISFKVLYNPSTFNRIDPKGIRYIHIKNAIVKAPPTAGVASFDGSSFVGPFNGTLNLIGGTLTEDDGTPILADNGDLIYLNDFFHLPFKNGSVSSSDGITFSNVSYTFTINHEVLVGHSLITLGCVPEVAADTQFINTTIGSQFNLNGAKLSGLTLPDVSAAQECILASITEYRSNVSIETTNQFQTNILNCLNDLKDQTISALTSAIEAGFDQYKSDFSLDTSIQFTTEPIKVSVSLNENSGNSMTINLPAAVAQSLAPQLSAKISLGDISSFAYDGYQAFIADITSSIPGNGDIKVAFNNNFISILNNPKSIDAAPSVSVKLLNYTFVSTSTRAVEAGKPIRDEGDVSRDGNNGNAS